MKVLIISDIHANLTALEAVLADAGSWDAVWCLGDLVGYGPDPNECIEHIRRLPNLVCLMGNHDAAVLDIIDSNAFNPEARTVVSWTKSVLSSENLAYLATRTARMVVDHITLAHGSPRYPIWEYLLDVYTARANFDHFTTDLCLVGHTHMPVIYQQRIGTNHAGLRIPDPNTRTELAPRMIINPGSVGQPRDRDPRASYAILDLDNLTWTYRRVAYDVTAVQERMLKVSLPERHIRRLSTGW
jgi:predicted phosphodiesterase